MWTIAAAFSPRSLAQEAGALEQFYVFRSVNAITAFGALRAGESETFPGADGGRRNADQTGHVPDFQVRLWAGSVHWETGFSGERLPCAAAHFLLDSTGPPFLTLRDYSKVGWARKRVS